MTDPRVLGAQSDIDLLLVNSPLKDYGREPRLNTFTLPTLGLGYIATTATAAGYSVAVLDSEALGVGIDEATSIINEASPRWVGLNLLAPTYRMSCGILAGVDRSINVMLGGHQAKAMPGLILRDIRIPRIDALIIGEGESCVPLLLADRNTRELLPQVGWRTSAGPSLPRPPGDQSLLAPDVNAMPFVDRSYFPRDPYWDGDSLESAMVASRGCPFDCSFCGAAVSANSDITIRIRDPENIMAEMGALRDRYGVSRVRFVDDLFLANGKLITQTLRAFVHGNLQMKWDATGRINVLDKVSNDVIDLMVASGCREVALGIETGSDRLLQHIDKKITVEQVRRSVPRLCAAGISVKGYFILGLPTETLDEHYATLALIKSLWEFTADMPGRFRCSAFEYRPYPGTPDWARLLRAGYRAEEMLAYDSPPDIVGAGLADRDEFNFSTGIRFGEVPIAEVRKNLFSIMELQNAQ